MSNSLGNHGCDCGCDDVSPLEFVQVPGVLDIEASPSIFVSFSRFRVDTIFLKECSYTSTSFYLLLNNTCINIL